MVNWTNETNSEVDQMSFIDYQFGNYMQAGYKFEVDLKNWNSIEYWMVISVLKWWWGKYQKSNPLPPLNNSFQVIAQ